ncbi:tRNA (guanine-N(7)-)-methyltransferase non-catalytic subunit wdr4 [Liparis tanakae]|uniref:tRNA (Guanine-N(7)-)-methyltransferase non-catalytic subunit wdr4 n=1 Tax=Liparis tanakae TaxID=230148 RepID=A0A4Z2G4A7_9TELE|nr:tRNA (guanine-N(7)-)-methyltransferase non-catalytic subunit wdr4 [Liparis tanakae]
MTRLARDEIAAPHVLPSHDTNTHTTMAAVGFCGEWFVFISDKKLVATHSKQDRDTFVFDCSTAEKKPKSVKEDHRWVVRRCTALTFSRAEDELLATDKSGDVYSFSVVEPHSEGELRMGHLSMLLAVSMSPDDKYLITADRDEKIRVSHRRSPHNIQSFCLGHQQFGGCSEANGMFCVHQDGTVKLWEYESGRKLQSCDLKELQDAASSEAVAHKATVCRITSSPDARYVAVQCERVSTVQLFTLHQEGEEKLLPHSRLSLPHCPLDMTFDPEGRLWVLMDSTSRGTGSRFEHLFKVSFDNVTSYLQKKQQRLEEQQLKRAKARKAGGSKKAKKEEVAGAGIQSSA